MHNQYPTWKYVLLIFMVVLGCIYAAPNLYGEDIAVQISLADSASIPKDTQATVEKALKKHDVPYLSAVTEEGQVLVRFSDTDTQLKASDLIKASLGDKYVVAPNLAPRTPEWLQAIGAKQVKLGLDLRGGVHFLLNVDMDAVMKARENGFLHSISSELRDVNIRYSKLKRNPKGGITIGFRNQESLNKAYKLLPKNFPQYTMAQNTGHGVYEINATITEAELIKQRNYSVEQSMKILRNRINELGVSEAVVQRQGASKIIVDLPGVQDTSRAKELIGKTATLEFHMLDEDHDLESALAGVVPLGSRLYTTEDGRPVLLKTHVILRGSSVTFANAGFGEDGRPQVNVSLGGGGESEFHRTTAASVGKAMAVVYVENKAVKKIVDGKLTTVRVPEERVISVATIQSALGNSFRITGLRSQHYAQNLALLLRSGSFNAPVDIVQDKIVGASLGKANIEKGIVSMIVGSIIVFVFMLLYYRLFGLFANIALVLDVIFMLAILSMIGATLTLPGIAGFVLTVGMAVDANVLINERIREELRNGMSPQASIRAGYERAFSTIIDAQVTTLIVAIVLFALGSGPVKGFAVTLTIGILTSLVTTIFFTRAVVNLVYGRKKQLQGLSIGTIRMA